MGMHGDPTTPGYPGRGRADGDPTMPIEPVRPVGGNGGYGDGGGGYGGGGYGEPAPNRRVLWLVIGAIFVVGALIGVLVAVASGGDDKKGGGDRPNRTTTTSSSTTTTSTSTTSTTTPAPTTTTVPAPRITSFEPVGDPDCSPGVEKVTLRWTTQNADDVLVRIDSSAGTLGPFGANVASFQFEFECGPGIASHNYTLTARRQGTSQTAIQTIKVDAP